MAKDERRADEQADKATESRKTEAQANQAPATPTFTGDIRGGGPGAGADLGRGGTSTPAGDIAGGGQPGSLVDIGEGTVSVRDAIPTGGAGDLAHLEPHEARQERLPEKPIETSRSATDGVPGVPAGSGTEHALETPDSELGGAVAADTTPGGDTEDKPDAEQVRREDRGRNTL